MIESKVDKFKPQLGELLVTHGLINKFQLEQAYKFAKKGKSEGRKEIMLIKLK